MPTDSVTPDQSSQQDTPPGAVVTPSGGIVTRTDGTDTPIITDWRASLPMELQQDPTLAKYKSMEDALRGAVHAQRLVGRGAEFPKADAKPEDIAEFRKRTGVPEKADGYKLTLPQAPEGQDWDQAKLGSFLGAMHAAHARPEVVQAAVDYFVKYTAGETDRQKALEADERNTDRAAAVRALESLWGPEGGPLWQHHATRAMGAIETLMGDAPAEAIQRIKESANDPEVAYAFSLLADSLVERGYIAAAEGGTTFGQAEAQARADAIRDAWAKDPKHVLNDPTHPQYAKAMREYEAYLATAAGPNGRQVVAEVRR